MLCYTSGPPPFVPTTLRQTAKAPESMRTHRICYVDESIQSELGVVCIAFVFVDKCVDSAVAEILTASGFDPANVEFKSGARMASDPAMRQVRDELMRFIATDTKAAVFFGPFERARLGRQALQALQSVVSRNGFDPNGLTLHFDQDIFKSGGQAKDLHSKFTSLKGSNIKGYENSLVCRGIQLADCLAHCFSQIIKAELTGEEKEVDVGGPSTSYDPKTMAPLSWASSSRRTLNARYINGLRR